MKSETKKEVKLEESKQRKVKGLSKAIYIITKIGKIVMIVLAPIVLLCMIALPLILSRVDVKDNEFVVNGKTKIEIIEDEKGVHLKYDDKVVAFEGDEKAILKIKDTLQNNSKAYIIGYAEVSFTIVLILLAIVFLTLRNIEKLFKNIHDGDTPFTLENVNYMRKTAKLLIALIVVPAILNLASSLVFKKNLDLSINGVTITEILFLFCLSYIFEYGYNLQSDSKAKMYGTLDEGK